MWRSTDGLVRRGLIVLFLLVATARSLAQPAWLTTVVRNALERGLPGAAEVGTVTIDNLGRLHIRDFELHDEGVPLALLSDATIVPDWLTLLSGTLGIRRIEADTVHVRLVRDSEGRSRWGRLASRLGNRADTPSKSPGSGSPVEILGRLTVHHADLVAQPPHGDLFHFHDITAEDFDIRLTGQTVAVTGVARGPGIDPVHVIVDVDDHKAVIEINSPSQRLTPEAVRALPSQIGRQLMTWSPQGSASVLYRYTGELASHDELQELVIEPLQAQLVPPGFSIDCHMRSGRLTLDPDTHDLILSDVQFDAGPLDQPPAVTGTIHSHGDRIHLRCRLRPGPVLAEGLPDRLSRILRYVGPSGPFEATWDSRGQGHSVEARFHEIDFHGVRPSLENVVGVVTCDIPAVGPPSGRASFSRLNILNIPFTRLDLGFRDAETFEMTPVVIEGPWAYAQGSLVADQGRLTGRLDCRGLDLRQWALASEGPEDLNRLNGVLAGSLELDVPEGAAHDQRIGSFKFRIDEANVVVSSKWLPIARLLKRPQDLLTLPLQALGGRQAEDISKLRLSGGRGTLTLNPNKFLVSAQIDGDPFNFEVSGKVRFSNRGELNFKPVLLTRYDPTILLMDLVPIPLVWPQEETSKP